MKKLVLFMLSFTLAFMAVAQERNYWTSNTDASRITTDKAVARQSFPKDFKLFNLDVDPLRQELFKVVGNSSRHSTIISLPNANGQIEQFEVYEASNFEPALQAQFPGIRAFSGKGITDKSATLKLSFSPQGIQTMVFRTEQENEFIEAYSQDHTVYAVFKSQRQSGQLPWRCSTPEEKLATDLNSQVAATGISARSGGNLKTMRLAQSCNAEYSNYFGATSSAQVALVLAAFNATLTRCNGVYEKDLALHLNLIANTTSVIYYNPSTDPYSTTLSQWNAQLQSTLTSVIGEANYDIGHMFGASGGGGNAGCIGCVCVNGSKGSGITSPNDGIPQGDNFDIDYVTHEVGHQLGANHTFSMSSEGTGVNKEVGSGITIMGYAGITSQDVAPHSIDIFHQASIAQIQSNLATKTCPVTTTITNATPVVSAGSNYTIPISTPFALTGSATDANAGDVLTYCWEQNDNSTTTGANSVASPTKATGPNWISFSPTTSPTRVFPKLATILAGANVSGPLPGGDAVANTEALSSVSRTLNFRLTVRDNAPYSSTAPISVGQTQFANMVVTVSNTSGPFAVTSPNSAVTWAGNSSQTVTWSVNNTTAAPVSCANVKISISTDGGNTFSTLVASTANDGSELVTIPNTPSTTARIKVEAVGNIFFDISNTNFTIGGAAACGNPTGLLSSSITNTSATVSWTAVSGALSYDVDYKATSSGTWINAATATTSTTVGLAGLVQGTTYDWRVRATCSGGSGSYVQAQFTTTAPCNTPAGLASSAITASSATVSWTAVSGANNYTVEYKTTAGSTWTTAASATTSTSQGLSGLSASTSYDWRVRANCASGSSAFAQAQFTTTIASTCPGTYDISTNGTASGAALIPKNTDIKGLISPSGDNDYYRFTIATGGTATITLTTLPADYDIRLYSSNGTTQLAISQNGSTTSETITRTYTAGTYYVRVYGYNNANNATSCYTLRVATGTATRQEDLLVDNKISVFPNPVTRSVNVRIPAVQGMADIKVFDMYGKMVMQKTSGQVNTQLDVSTLPAGIYMVKVMNDGKESTMKIVKE
ncbi:MAG: T9SS type A sorting domain-containing protein [Chitinophagaceae bacterium]|nr:T9SS type A sorting domain-containing protein [Chitinophagaceae bacterium]MBK9938672.1 T9SS type A sorting domain-containing protein [Chitinophagaceae bacterium]MBP6233877.1 T9SS type A sorting domain-containing protein [Chitinophagaceae bacterium]